MPFDPSTATLFDESSATEFDPSSATLFDPSTATLLEEGDFDRNALEIGSDLAVSFGVGANQLLKIAGDLYGLTTGDMNNIVSQQGQSGTEYWSGKKSDQLLSMEQDRKTKIDNAKGFSVAGVDMPEIIHKAGTAFWETIKSPSLLSSFLVEQAPMLLPIGAAGRGAQGITKAAGFGKAAQATAATGTAVSAGAAMQGADAGSQAYEQLMSIPDQVWQANDEYAAMVSQGMSGEEAKRSIATDLSQDAAIASGIISIGTNLLPGARILEKGLAGVKLPGGRISNAIKGFFGESIQEGLEEGGGALSANLATQIIDPFQQAYEGVGEATGMGAASGIIGGVIGAANTSDQDNADIITKVTSAETVDDAIAAASEVVDQPVYDNGVDFTSTEDVAVDTTSIPDMPAPLQAAVIEPGTEHLIPQPGKDGIDYVPPVPGPLDANLEDPLSAESRTGHYEGGVNYQPGDIPAKKSDALTLEGESQDDNSIDYYTGKPKANINKMAASVEKAQADYSRQTRLPENLQDPRLARDPFRGGLETMAAELKEGGGAMGDLIGGEFTSDETTAVGQNGEVKRLKSENPQWYQEMAKEHPGMTVAKTKEAVRKANAGEKLGVGEIRAVTGMMDILSGERTDPANIEAVKQELQAARKFRAEVARGLPPVEAYESDIANAAEVFDEAEYEPEWDGIGRSLFEMYTDASQIDQAEADNIFNSGGEDYVIATRLAELLHRGQSDEKSETTDATAEVDSGQGNAESEGQATAGTQTGEEVDGRSNTIPSSDLGDNLNRVGSEVQGSAASENRNDETATGQRSTTSKSTDSSQSEEVDAAANEAATSPENNLPEPTDAQREAENFKMGHINVQGLDISIEYPRGSKRTGTNKAGKSWSRTMFSHYGRIKRTEGADGEQVDVFVGQNPESDKVYIVDQNKQDGTFDEHKVMLAYDSVESATKGYQKNYPQDWKGLGNITEVTVDEFKDWLKNGDTKKEYAGSKKQSNLKFAQTAEEFVKDIASEGRYVPRPYPEESDVENETRLFAHRLKDGDKQAARVLAIMMEKGLPENAVIVPVPGRNGYPGIEKTIAEDIRLIAKRGISSVELLSGAKRESQYEIKKRGGTPLKGKDFGFNKNTENFDGDKNNVYLLDAVVGTGSTLEAATEALNRLYGIKAKPLVFTIDHDAYNKAHKSKPVIENADLFGEDTTKQQALADKKAEIDKKLGKSQEAVPAESAGDLFDTNRGKQMDITDVPANKLPDIYEARKTEKNLQYADEVQAVVDTLNKDSRAFGELSDITSSLTGLAGNLKKGVRVDDLVIPKVNQHIDSLKDSYPDERKKVKSLLTKIENEAKRVEKERADFRKAKKLGESQENQKPSELSELKSVVKDLSDAVKATTELVKSQSAPKQAEEVETANTDDVGGEMIANRRYSMSGGLSWKDISGENATLKTKEVVKAKVWPKPDYQKLIDEGMPHLLAYRIKMVYDSIASKPQVRNPTDKDFQDYIEVVHSVRDALDSFSSNAAAIAAYAQAIAGGRKSSLMAGIKAEETDAKFLLDKVFPLQGEARSNERFAGYSTNKQPWQQENNRRANLIGGNKAVKAMQMPSGREVSKMNKDLENGWPTPQKAWQRRGFKILKKEDFAVSKGTAHYKSSPDSEWKKKTVFNVQAGPGHYAPRVGAFDTETEAESARDAIKPFLLADKGNHIIGQYNTQAEVEAAAEEQTKTVRQKVASEGIKVEKAIRKGKERREGGRNVGTEELKQTFGFMKINFGNWMKGDTPAKRKERQLHANHAYDALMDLAEVLNIPPKAIGLNGMLSLAVGAQGKGGNASAHFVPGVNEINITRKAGAGSLAHEWGHALDHYFAIQAGLATREEPFLTEKGYMPIKDAEIRPEIVEAFDSIVNAMENRDQTPEEIAANSNRQLERSLKYLESWLKSARNRIEKGDNKTDALLTKYDALADRLRKGDRGEGYAKSGNKSFPVVVAEIRDLVKEATGRLLNLEATEQLDNNSRSVNYHLTKEASDNDHIPQTTTEYKAGARRLEGTRKKAYWSTKLEMFARAFESYVLDKVTEKAGVSDYLVSSGKAAFTPEDVEKVDDPLLKAIMQETLDRYPQGEERIAINAQFDKLIDEIKTRETDQGIALYSLEADTDTQGKSVEFVQDAIAPALDKISEAVGIQVKVLGDNWRTELPVAAVRGIPAGKRPKGVQYGDTTYLIAPHIKSARDANVLLAHESIGHFAMEAVTTTEKWNEAMAIFRRTKKQGANKQFNAIMDRVNEHYGSQDEVTQLKEFVAMAAESRVTEGPVARILRIIREGLRKFLKSLNIKTFFTNTDLDIIISGAERYLRKGETGDANNLQPAFSVSENNEKFFSQLLKSVQSAQQSKATPEQWLAMMRKSGVKQEEIDWLGVEEFMGDKSITKDDLIDFINSNRVEVKEVTKGEELTEKDFEKWMNKNRADDDPYYADIVGTDEYDEYKEAFFEEMVDDDPGKPKFQSYVLPGGENYRELLLRLPDNKTMDQESLEKYGKKYDELDPKESSELMSRKAGKQFHGGHYDESNVLAHIRFNDRIDADGKKVLFIEEIQSDWHQAGRKEGYKGEVDYNRLIDEFNDRMAKKYNYENEPNFKHVMLRNLSMSEEEKTELNNLSKLRREVGINPVPDAPFKKSWPLLAMKHMLRHAVENGYDRVAWTTGEQQVKRYDLSKHLSRIDYEQDSDGSDNYDFAAVDKHGEEVISEEDITLSRIEELVGKEIAEKIKNSEGKRTNAHFEDGYRDWRTLDGLDLKVGGEGMKGFYDIMLKSITNKYVKKWGGKVNMLDIAIPETALTGETLSDRDPYLVRTHSLDITPAMRESVMQGQPLFMVEAYHGTPHNVDKFSVDKIGTGEGAQAYGYGLYFAENPKVAGHYAPSGRTMHDVIHGDGSAVAQQKEVVAAWQKKLNEAIKNNKTSGYGSINRMQQRLNDEIFTLNAIEEEHKKGNLYNVNLNVNHEDLLDWDAPLSEQPESLQSTFIKILDDKYFPNKLLNKIFPPRGTWAESTGRTLYQTLARDVGQKQASEILKEAGIPGIRYFDGNSRRKGEGSSNYVIFDDSLIEITHENGKPVSKQEREDAIDEMHEQQDTSSPQKQTDTPAFKKWFGDSKVVDEDGAPLVVYHGTTRDIIQSNEDKIFWASVNPSLADDYAIHGQNEINKSDSLSDLGLGANIMPVYMSINNPVKFRHAEQVKSITEILSDAISQSENDINNSNIENIYNNLKARYGGEKKTLHEFWQSEQSLISFFRNLGFDGIAVHEKSDMRDMTYAAFDPTQIKSATGNKGTFDSNNPDIRYSLESTHRSNGLPKSASNPVSTFRKINNLKDHKDYEAAKAGEIDAAERIVRDLVTKENYAAALRRFGENAIYAPVHAEEAAGINKIPVMLASAYAAATNGSVDNDIIQANRAFHTGANAMERMVSRPAFAGNVQKGGKYVIVDDVTTMGSTLAEMANHIQSNGGEVIGTVLLANASRTVTMSPTNKTLQELERRYGDEIRQQFSIEPSALTAAEAQYLIGFRDANELRTRASKARLENSKRLRAKGIPGKSAEQVNYSLEADPAISGVSSLREDTIQQSSVARKKIKRWFKRNLTKEGLMNKAAFEIKLKSDALKNVGEEEIAYLVHDFEKSLKKAYGKQYNDYSQNDIDALYGYLTGDKAAALSDEVKASLDNMRSYLDNLSGEMIKSIQDIVDIKVSELSMKQREEYELALATNGEEGKIPEHIATSLQLMQTIDANKGSYLNRSYQAFDDENWKDKALADKQLIRDAETFIQENNPDLSNDEVRGAVRAILQSAKDSGNFVSMIAKGTKVGSKDVSITKKRKDVPEVIRRLLGEHKDPKLNFARSASKMQWYVANHHFLTSLRENGLNNFLYTKPTGEFDTQIAGDASETMNPLNGLYTTEDFRQGMEDVLDKFDGSDLMRDLIRANSVVKYGKTILSPTTQARNFMSAYFFRIMNGHFSLRHDVKAFKAARADLFTHDKEWQEYLNDLIGLGVLHDNPFASELKAALKDAMELNIYKKGATQQARKFLSFMQRMYQVGDDFHKITGFEQELKILRDNGVPLEEARKKAAYRIRNGYPTYSMVPRAVKKLRRWPLIGTFVSFPYEIIRTTYNQAGFIKEDWKDNKSASVRRMLGFAIASSAAYAASKLSMILMGMDDDDDEAVRAQLPEWSRNSQLYYIGYDEDGLPIYLDLSYLDPYTYLKKPFTALTNNNNQGFDKKVTDALTELAEPFIGTDIAAGAALELWSNKKSNGGQVYNPEDTAYRQTKDILNHARKTLQPGAMSNIERTILAIQEESTQSGKQYKVKDEALAWVGFRVGTLNLNQSMIYKAYGFADAKRSATTILSRTAGSQSDVSQDDISDAYNSMMRARERAYRDMIKLVDGARKLGVSDDDIRTSLRSAKLSKVDVAHILKGTVPKWKMSPQFIKSATDRAITSSPGSEKKAKIRQEMLKRRMYINRLTKGDQ